MWDHISWKVSIFLDDWRNNSNQLRTKFLIGGVALIALFIIVVPIIHPNSQANQAPIALPTCTPYPTYTPLPTYAVEPSTALLQSPAMTLPTPAVELLSTDMVVNIYKNSTNILLGNIDGWQKIISFVAAVLAVFSALGFKGEDLGDLLRLILKWVVGAGLVGGFLMWMLVQWNSTVSLDPLDIITNAATHALVVGGFAASFRSIFELEKKGLPGLWGGLAYGAVTVLLTGLDAQKSLVILITFGSIAYIVGYIIDDVH